MAAECAVAFFDVDGTLVWHDYAKLEAEEHEAVSSLTELRPTPAVYEAFASMRAAGHRTFICTGRHLPFISQTIRDLNPDGFVAGAGAYVCVGDHVIRDECIDHDLLIETARRLERAGIDTIFEGDKDNIELNPTGSPARFTNSHLARSAVELARLAEGHRYCKLCTKGFYEQDFAPVRAFLDTYYTTCDLQGGTFEFSLRGVDKGTGIEAVLAYLGHGKRGTYAFGDSENDLSMVGSVETFVAMGNALPGVKDCADYVTLTAAEEGVPVALEHFGLI